MEIKYLGHQLLRRHSPRQVFLVMQIKCMQLFAWEMKFSAASPLGLLAVVDTPKIPPCHTRNWFDGNGKHWIEYKPIQDTIVVAVS